MTYRQIYKYRSVWMGIAILWIMVYHAKFQFRTAAIGKIAGLGYSGVDIFLFASGLGCAFSYKRIRNSCEFILRRLRRVYPAYFLFMLIWLPWHYVINKMPLMSIPGNLLGFEYFIFSGYSFNWYFPFMVILYFLTPFLTEFAERNKGPVRGGAVLLFLLLFSFTFFEVHDYIIMAARLPVYMLGILFAVNFDENEKVGRRTAGLLAGALAAGVLLILYVTGHFGFHVLWERGLFWYPFLLTTPGLCFLISWICGKMQSAGGALPGLMIRALSGTGSLSLELYFLHLYFIDLYHHYFEKQKDPVMAGGLLLSLLSAFLLHRLTEQLTRLLRRPGKASG